MMKGTPKGKERTAGNEASHQMLCGTPRHASPVNADSGAVKIPAEARHAP